MPQALRFKKTKQIQKTNRTRKIKLKEIKN